MNRREFLLQLGGGLIALPVVLQVAGCGDDPAAPAGDTHTTHFHSTSQPDGTGHAHTITVECTDLSQSGFQFTSTSISGHTHRVTLSQAQLLEIAAGTSVGPITSTTDGGHAHAWTFSKPAGVC
jgi:hypothetical protein